MSPRIVEILRERQDPQYLGTHAGFAPETYYFLTVVTALTRASATKDEEIHVQSMANVGPQSNRSPGE